MKKRTLSILLTLALCLSLAVPAMAANSDAVYGTENDHVIPQSASGTTVTSPDGTFTVTNVLKQKICDTDYYKGRIGCVGMPIYWVADTGTEITFSGAKAGAEFVIGDMLFYEEGHADDNAGYGAYTAPLKIWLSDTEQADPVHYTDNFYYAITYQGKTMLICFMKDDGVPAEPTTPAATAFTDVPADAYYAKPVEWAVENKITSGTSATTFSPDQNCTRAQIIMFLWKAAGAPEPTITETTFRDVTDPNAYYYKAILWAQETGIIGGGRFAPDDPCTRAFAMYFIWKAKGSPEAGQAPFTDMPEDPGFVSAINWAVANSITGGTSATTFSPQQTCTRGQIMTFLYKTFG